MVLCPRPLGPDRLYAFYDKQLTMQFDQTHIVYFNAVFFHLLVRLVVRGSLPVVYLIAFLCSHFYFILDQFFSEVRNRCFFLGSDCMAVDEMVLIINLDSSQC